MRAHVPCHPEVRGEARFGQLVWCAIAMVEPMGWGSIARPVLWQRSCSTKHARTHFGTQTGTD